MTELTTGQRIALCRKKLALSQEALGEKMGVSRQAISKWEADAALPDVDKLIALSRLFCVSVGWLLGVEEQPEPQPEEPRISEELLRKIEEVVRRYQPQKKRLSTGRKVLIGIAAVLLLWGGVKLSRQWQNTLLEVSCLGTQLRNNNAQNSSILRQLDALEERIDSINDSVKEASASLADYEFSISPNMEAEYARVEITAFPRNWNGDWTAELNVRYQGALSVTQQCYWDGTALNGAVKLNLVDGLEYWLVIGYPDGTRESVKLENEQAQNLRHSYSIVCDMNPEVVDFGPMSMHSELYLLLFSSDDLYLRRPNPEEDPASCFWTRADYVLDLCRNNERTTLETRPLMDLEAEAKTYECFGGFYHCYPEFSIEYPQNGDVYELWVMLELANGASLEQCVGSWTFRDGEFLKSEP